MCSSVEYEDDNDGYEKLSPHVLMETLTDGWNKTFHSYKNFTLHNVMIYTDTIHVNFYVIISLLVIFLIIYALKCLQIIPPSPFSGLLQRKGKNEVSNDNQPEEQALRHL